MKTKQIIVAASMMLFSIGMAAQPPVDVRNSQTQEGESKEHHQMGERHPHKQLTPEQMAKREAGMMSRELGLSEKQYKKVYKLLKKDYETREAEKENRFADGMPNGFGGPGMGGPGGMGGGMMGGGPMGGGVPPRMEMENGERPEGMPEMSEEESIVTEEYLAKKEKKLQKILTEEQYNKWRAKHPAEHIQLPPIEFDKVEE